MKYAKPFSIFVFTVAALYGAIGFYCLPLASYHGDLTRIGMLPDALFGWAKPQPAIAPALLEQSSWSDADVVVIGDSFSEHRVWQSVLISHGLHVRTEHWDNIHNICGDFSPWLRTQGFKGKFVVIEAVERNAKDLFSNSVHCKNMDVRKSLRPEAPQAPPETSVDYSRRDLSGKMSVGIRTRINMARYEQRSARPDFSTWTRGDVRVTRVPHGCELFSHARCQDALFLRLDSDEDLGAEVISNMEILNGRFDGITPIWAVVPNKSTAYLHPEKRFWGMAEQRLRSVNLLNIMCQAIRGKMVDVYSPSDTHLSTSGYLLMGEEMYRNIEQNLAGRSAPKASH